MGDTLLAKGQGAGWLRAQSLHEVRVLGSGGTPSSPEGRVWGGDEGGTPESSSHPRPQSQAWEMVLGVSAGVSGPPGAFRGRPRRGSRCPARSCALPRAGNEQVGPGGPGRGRRARGDRRTTKATTAARGGGVLLGGGFFFSSRYFFFLVVFPSSTY